MIMNGLHRRLLSSLTNTNPSVPNPSFMDLLRNGFPLTNFDENVLDFWQQCNKSYGDIFTFKLPLGPKGVVLYNPHDAEIVYRSSGKWPNRPGFLILEDFRSNRSKYEHSAGLLSSQKKPWYDFRSKVQVALLKPKLIKTYHERVDGVAQDFIEKVFQHSLTSNDCATSDLIEHLYQWGLESVGILAFDRRLGVISTSISSDSEAQEIVNCVQRIFALSQILEMNQIWKIIGSLFPKYREAIQLLGRMEEIAAKYTDEKIASIKDTRTDSETSVIETLYKAGCNRDILSTLAVDMLMAGVDTAANQISFAFYFLAHNLEAQDKLYEEVISLDMSDPNFIENAPYLRACLKEVMRLKPTTHGNARISEQTIQLPNNFKIEKGTIIFFLHYFMSRDSRFVSDPLEFRPERHIKGLPQHEKLHPFTSLPFGHGARSCVGKRFANLEICLLLSRIVRKYRLESTSEPLKITIPLLMKPKGAIPVRFVLR